jgi:hypothetical protein
MNQILKLSWQIANNNNRRQNGQDHNDSNNILTIGDYRTRLQALSLINDCYKYIMDLTTNGVVITDAIKFVQTNKEKLMSKDKDNDSKEIDEPDKDKDRMEKEVVTPESEDRTTNLTYVQNFDKYLTFESIYFILP